MKCILLILSVSALAITALHAQVPVVTPVDPAVQAAAASTVDPAMQAAIDAFLPHKYAAYSSLIIVAFLFLSRVRQGRLNKLSWLDAILAAVNGTNVPTKIPLLIACLALLTLPSCKTFQAALASQTGQTTLAKAAQLGKAIGNAAEITALQISISDAQLYLKTLQTTPASTNPADLILRTMEIATVQAGITAGQAKLLTLTSPAKNPVPVTN